MLQTLPMWAIYAISGLVLLCFALLVAWRSETACRKVCKKDADEYIGLCYSINGRIVTALGYDINCHPGTSKLVDNLIDAHKSSKTNLVSAENTIGEKDAAIQSLTEQNEMYAKAINVIGKKEPEWWKTPERYTLSERGQKGRFTKQGVQA